MIKFECSHCGHQIKAQDNAAGIRSKCPRCQANITVPMPESSEPVFEGTSDYSELFADKKSTKPIDPRIKAVAKAGAEKVGRIARLTLYVGGGGFAFLVLIGAMMNLANPDAALKSRAERLEKQAEELREENRNLIDQMAQTPSVKTGQTAKVVPAKTKEPYRRTAIAGEVTRLSSGPGFCAATRKDYDRMNTLSKAGDETGLVEMLLNGRLYSVKNGTKVRVIETYFTVFEVRVEEGGHAGYSCFVGRSWLEKIPDQL